MGWKIQIDFNIKIKQKKLDSTKVDYIKLYVPNWQIKYLLDEFE